MNLVGVSTHVVLACLHIDIFPRPVNSAVSSLVHSKRSTDCVRAFASRRATEVTSNTRHYITNSTLFSLALLNKETSVEAAYSVTVFHLAFSNFGPKP